MGIRQALNVPKSTSLINDQIRGMNRDSVDGKFGILAEVLSYSERYFDFFRLSKAYNTDRSEWQLDTRARVARYEWFVGLQIW